MRKKRKRYRSNTNTSKSTTYIDVYPKSLYDKDESNFQKSLDNGQIQWDAFQRLMVHDLAINTRLLDTGWVGNIDIEKVKIALLNPKHHWRTILYVSEQLMKISPHYYRLNQFYSNMALFCWGIDLYDVKENANIETIKKMYNALASKLENMHLKHEFSKIMKSLPYKDIFCGLLVENQNDSFIQELNYKVCKLYQVQDGLYNFIIDLSAIEPQCLSAYPDYVQEAFLHWRDNMSLLSKWYEPPAEKQICIKLNSQWLYPFPLLIGIVQDILDLDVFKKLKLQSARTDNYKAILIEVPIDKSTVDKPLLTPETLGIFAQINRNSMSDDIGLLYTLGASGEAISFKDSNNTRNNVSDAIDEIYNSSGETQELFNGSSSATAVTFSIENSSGFIYGLYRQFERWTNRYIKLHKYHKSTFKFYFYLLDITIFNRNQVADKYKNAVAMGMTVIDKWVASLDMTPSRLLGSYITHQDIFNYHEHFIPLQTSYNSSVDNTGGRPTNESKGELLDESGEQTADGDRNKR